MLNREHIKNEIDTLPDFVIEKVQDFITFQKFSLAVLEQDKAASFSNTDFWDNPDDEVWNHI
jgi:hypothetical protein